MTLPLFLKSVLASCQAAPSADNSQPCHIDWCPPKLVLRYDTERVSGLTFPAESQATLLSVGAMVENIIQCCDFAENNPEVAIFPEDASADVFVEINLNDADLSVSVNKQLPLFSRHTNRFVYKREAISQAIIKEVGRLESGGAKIRVLRDSASINSIAEQIQAASEIRFQTQEVHEWLGRSLRFTPEQAASGNGLDVATLDLPPGGGLFLRFIGSWSRMQRLNRIGGYKVLASIDAAPIKKAPAVLAITGRNTKRGALEAGRLLCRVWIYLNAQGVACHPYYVVSDQLERLENNSVPEALVPRAEIVRKESRQLLNLKEGETLMMLLRVGYPKREAPRSRRLPLGEVFTDWSASSNETG